MKMGSTYNRREQKLFTNPKGWKHISDYIQRL